LHVNPGFCFSSVFLSTCQNRSNDSQLLLNFSFAWLFAYVCLVDAKYPKTGQLGTIFLQGVSVPSQLLHGSWGFNFQFQILHA
jgi:hypothetical protein